MSSASDRLLAAGILAFALAVPGAPVTAQEVEAQHPPAGKSTIGPVPGTDARQPDTRNPLAGDLRAQRDGRRLFVAMNCSGCHGGRAGGGMGPSLRDERWIYGDSDAQIFDSIAQGRAHGMPAWGTRLPEREIWKLVAYIRTLRTAQEPDRPRP